MPHKIEITEYLIVKPDTLRQINAFINNKPVFLRRCTLNTNENSIIFTEKQNKTIIKYDPLTDKFSKIILQTVPPSLQNPFAIKYLQSRNCYLTSDLNDNTPNQKACVKLFDENFNLKKIFQNKNLKWPYDIAVNESDGSFFVSDFNLNKIYSFNLNDSQSDDDPIESNFLKEYMPLDIKILANNQLFVIDSCNYEAIFNKLVDIEAGANCIHVLDCHTFKHITSITHENLLHPQGLVIDENCIYTVGLYVDKNQIIQDDLYLFCFNLTNFKLEYVQNLCIAHEFQFMVCDFVVWKKFTSVKKLFFTLLHKCGLFAIDCV